MKPAFPDPQGGSNGRSISLCLLSHFARMRVGEKTGSAPGWRPGRLRRSGNRAGGKRSSVKDCSHTFSFYNLVDDYDSISRVEARILCGLSMGGQMAPVAPPFALSFRARPVGVATATISMATSET